MGKVGVFIKTASTILATSVALLTAMRENPQIAEGIDSAIDKLKKATNSQNPKLRFDAKLAAIVAAADAVEQTFPSAAEPAGWAASNRCPRRISGVTTRPARARTCPGGRSTGR